LLIDSCSKHGTPIQEHTGMLNVKICRLAVVGALLAGAALYAQTGSGTIAGVVFDNLGSPLPQAEVRVKNSATGAQVEVSTSAKGEYSVAGLAAGTYEIAVIVHGMRMHSEQNVAVESGKPLKMDVH